MIADLERAILERASARITCVVAFRVEYRPGLYGKRRSRRGIADWQGSVALVAARPSLLDELAPFAPREQLRSALDVARAADLHELFEIVDSGDIQLLRIRARIACLLESYSQPSRLANNGDLRQEFPHAGRSSHGGRQ